MWQLRSDVLQECYLSQGNTLSQYARKWRGNWQLQHAAQDSAYTNIDFIADNVSGGLVPTLAPLLTWFVTNRGSLSLIELAVAQGAQAYASRSVVAMVLKQVGSPSQPSCFMECLMVRAAECRMSLNMTVAMQGSD